MIVLNNLFRKNCFIFYRNHTANDIISTYKYPNQNEYYFDQQVVKIRV